MWAVLETSPTNPVLVPRWSAQTSKMHRVQTAQLERLQDNREPVRTTRRRTDQETSLVRTMHVRTMLDRMKLVPTRLAPMTRVPIILAPTTTGPIIVRETTSQPIAVLMPMVRSHRIVPKEYDRTSRLIRTIALT